MTYRLNIKTKKNENLKKFEIATVPILSFRDTPELTIESFIKVVPLFKTEGWLNNKHLIMRFGGKDKLAHEEYIFDAEREEVIKKVYMNLNLAKKPT